MNTHQGWACPLISTLIFSLSLAGPCIMEFRRYQAGIWQSDPAMSKIMHEENPENSTNFLRRAIYLPPRSMLLLSGEASYAWNHYIPHHKVDNVKDSVIRRAPRRVSFTLRKVSTGPCCCEYGFQTVILRGRGRSSSGFQTVCNLHVVTA